MNLSKIEAVSKDIFETHCHLDYLKDRPLQTTLDLSNQYNIKKINTIAVSPEHLDDILNLSNKYENVYCTQGIHPHEADKVDQSIIDIVKKNTLSSNKVLAIGEIGLDFHYTKSPKKKQIEVFENFLQLSIDLNKPVVIHTREAEEETISILKNFLPQINKNIVFHSFTSSKLLADFAVKNKIFFGINGIITFNKSDELREVISGVPKELLVLETDSPFLAPMPFRGKENAPFLIPMIARKLAKIKELEVDDLLEQCWINSHQLFDLEA